MVFGFVPALGFGDLAERQSSRISGRQSKRWPPVVFRQRYRRVIPRVRGSEEGGEGPRGPQRQRGRQDAPKKQNKGNEEDEEDEEDEEYKALLAELDRDADAWAGTDLDRWYWYEGMKAKRSSLRQQLRRSEEEAAESIEELKGSLRELEVLTGVEFLRGNNEDLTATAYLLFAVLLIAPVFIAYWISSEIAHSFATLVTPFGM